MTENTYDKTLSARFNISERHGWRRTLAIIITRSGDALYLLVIMALLVLLGSLEWKRWALIMLIVDLVNLIVTQILKTVYRRKRPDGTWGQKYRNIDPHSFPSGHSSRGGAIGWAILLSSPLWLGIPALVWGMALACSRVLMGVHFPSDTLAGYLLGAIIGACVVLVL